MRLVYEEKRFNAKTLEIIEQANAIIDSYAAAGFELTLRQLYYQFVARGLIENTERSYKRIGSIISDGRLAGLISWHAIQDRTRNLQSKSHWRDPAQIVSACTSITIDLWQGQPRRVEVWVEKDALIGVIEAACRPLDVPYFSCRGYTSQSEMWQAGQRFYRYEQAGQTPLVIHLGDHDPSGIDMSRDIAERLAMFSGFDIEVRRIALSMDQVQEHQPPPNPAKATDSRFIDYSKRYGDESWELDALEPALLVELVQSEIKAVRDDVKYYQRFELQTSYQEALQKASDNWEQIEEFLTTIED